MLLLSVSCITFERWLSILLTIWTKKVHFLYFLPSYTLPLLDTLLPRKGHGTRNRLPTAPNRMTDRRMWKHYLPATPVADGSNYWALDSVAQNSTFSVHFQKTAMLLITLDRLHKDLFINDLLWSAWLTLSHTIIFRHTYYRLDYLIWGFWNRYMQFDFHFLYCIDLCKFWI